MGCSQDSSPGWPYRFLLTLVVLTALSPTSLACADPIHFMFGVPAEMTLQPNQSVAIPAAIINSGTRALNFDCGDVCGVPWTVAMGFFSFPPADQEFGPPPYGNGATVFQQFAGLTLQPGQRFDFVFGSVDMGNTPIGTVPSWVFEFLFRPAMASNLPMITVGPHTALSPLAFVDSTLPPAPEPATVLLVGSGLLCLLRRRTAS